MMGHWKTGLDEVSFPALCLNLHLRTPRWILGTTDHFLCFFSQCEPIKMIHFLCFCHYLSFIGVLRKGVAKPSLSRFPGPLTPVTPVAIASLN